MSFRKTELMQTTLSFGKHKGKLFRELPRDYVNWIIENVTSGRNVVQVLKVKELLELGYEFELDNEPEEGDYPSFCRDDIPF